ncbi:hypothetical protein NQ318_019009 [Aromia moschata]|uniref:DUF4817 domain-containing protein n=1 Tax=Aromia moschata TaxID=1265417 RepID=A0AAV8YFF7_9CUCU|nr:hypothetical protein NQ318_019009 [Aromia moschata]
MSLSDTQKIEILIVLGCGDKTRTQKQVCEIFNTNYPDHRISQSTRYLSKSGRKRILDDKQELDILLDIQDNPYKPTHKLPPIMVLAKCPYCVF